MAKTPEEAPMFFHVKDLIAPLSDNSEGVLQECGDDQESRHGRYVGFERLTDGIDYILCLRREPLDLLL
jgi:hypothetical protein